ncbi:hypothetical protein BB560_002104 [Smittium megazygosporum]|uniref:Structure-specific endonuclease subunit SLX4 n=1 Tax=Smittium megazygosporum TaxID=133381 RepID=A0A2T9ZFP2_9FUNG|nr:hypothetical protein BB560_002104 [Smittium megazygosporum]
MKPPSSFTPNKRDINTLPPSQTKKKLPFKQKLSSFTENEKVPIYSSSSSTSSLTDSSSFQKLATNKSTKDSSSHINSSSKNPGSDKRKSLKRQRSADSNDKNSQLDDFYDFLGKGKSNSASSSYLKKCSFYKPITINKNQQDFFDSFDEEYQTGLALSASLSANSSFNDTDSRKSKKYKSRIAIPAPGTLKKKKNDIQSTDILSIQDAINYLSHRAVALKELDSKDDFLLFNSGLPTTINNLSEKSETSYNLSGTENIESHDERLSKVEDLQKLYPQKQAKNVSLENFISNQKRESEIVDSRKKPCDKKSSLLWNLCSGNVDKKNEKYLTSVFELLISSTDKASLQQREKISNANQIENSDFLEKEGSYQGIDGILSYPFEIGKLTLIDSRKILPYVLESQNEVYINKLNQTKHQFYRNLVSLLNSYEKEKMILSKEILSNISQHSSNSISLHRDYNVNKDPLSQQEKINTKDNLNLYSSVLGLYENGVCKRNQDESVIELHAAHTGQNLNNIEEKTLLKTSEQQGGDIKDIGTTPSKENNTYATDQYQTLRYSSESKGSESESKSEISHKEYTANSSFNSIQIICTQSSLSDPTSDSDLSSDSFNDSYKDVLSRLKIENSYKMSPMLSNKNTGNFSRTGSGNISNSIELTSPSLNERTEQYSFHSSKRIEGSTVFENEKQNFEDFSQNIQNRESSFLFLENSGGAEDIDLHSSSIDNNDVLTKELNLNGGNIASTSDNIDDNFSLDICGNKQAYLATLPSITHSTFENLCLDNNETGLSNLPKNEDILSKYLLMTMNQLKEEGKKYGLRTNTSKRLLSLQLSKIYKELHKSKTAINSIRPLDTISNSATTPHCAHSEIGSLVTFENDQVRDASLNKCKKSFDTETITSCIMGNDELYAKVVVYEPLEVDSLRLFLKNCGTQISKQDLIYFLDNQVSFTNLSIIW